MIRNYSRNINGTIRTVQRVWVHSKGGGRKIPQNGQPRENTEEEAQRKNATHFGRWDTEDCEGKTIEWYRVRATARDRERWRAVSEPSGTPSAAPSGTPSGAPSGTLSATPSGTPAGTPSGTPSGTGGSIE